MSKIPDPTNLDIRFRAVEVVPDPTDPEPVEDTNAVNHLHPLGKFHRAIVLLAPGAQLPFELTNVVQLLDDTFIVEAELNTLSELAGQKEVVYIEAPRPADISRGLYEPFYQDVREPKYRGSGMHVTRAQRALEEIPPRGRSPCPSPPS